MKDRKIGLVFFYALLVSVLCMSYENKAWATDTRADDTVRPEVKQEVDDHMVFTPAEIKYIKEQRQKRQAATARPVKEVKPVIRSVRLDLSPGGQSERIRVQVRYGASMVFTDRNGEPWPVQAISEFASDYFEVTQPVESGAVVNVSTTENFREGNVSLILQGLSIPIVLTLDSSQEEVDQRIDLVVPRLGPGTPAQDTRRGGSVNLPQFNRLLTDILIGLAPPGGDPLQVTMEDADGREGIPSEINVWRIDDQLYLRSPYALVSPAPSQVQTSADGTKAYVLPVSPILLISDPGSGKFQKIKVGL